MNLKVPSLKDINNYRGRFAMLMGVVLLVLVLVIFLAGSSPSPIPKSISSAVAYPIYYPDPSRLPPGYSLNPSNIEVIKPGVTILFVSFNSQPRYIVISEEVKPSDSIISSFLSSNIPLHTTFSTPIGQASVGAYNDGRELRSVISLPVSNGPWVIATAPSNLANIQFEKIIDSLIKN